MFLSFKKKGFTVFEIMIVLALIGGTFATVSYMTNDTRIYQTRAERLATAIADQIKAAQTNMTIGKGVAIGGSLFSAEQRTIVVTQNKIETQYTVGTFTGTEDTLQSPFFDNDTSYKIADLSISDQARGDSGFAWDYTGATQATLTILPNGSLSITAEGSPAIIALSVRTLRITASYNGFNQSVIIDRISGTTELVTGTGGGLVSIGCQASDGSIIMHGMSATIQEYPNETVPFGSNCGSKISQTHTCTNGFLSPPSGYASCATLSPTGCTAQNITNGNAHTYAVGALSHNSSLTGSVTLPISNGTGTYQQRFDCYNGGITYFSPEVAQIVCVSGYSSNGTSCILNACMIGNGTVGMCIIR